MADTIQLPSGTTAVLCLPADGRAPSQGLVVAPDIGGLRPLFDELCQRLADDHGWAVCAPEPWPDRETLTIDERLDAVSTLVDDDVLGDLMAAADAVDAHTPGGSTMGIIGFCMGGMYTFKASATGRFDRAAAFYGMIRLPEGWRGPAQSEPIDAVAAEDSVPVLAIIGTNDPYTPSDDVDALEEAGAVVVRYAGAEHGFVHDPDRPGHRADYAADAWRRVITWLGG